jgi:flagellar biosynthesis protein FlhA
MPPPSIATHLSHLDPAARARALRPRRGGAAAQESFKTAPKLVDELVPKGTAAARSVVRVMQGLLAERVPIRNVRAIVEALAEAGPRTTDPQMLIGQVRVALGRQIVQDIVGLAESCPSSHLSRNSSAYCQTASRIPPPDRFGAGAGRAFATWIVRAAQRQERGGEPAVLLTPPALRTALARFFRVSVPGLHVLAWNEVPTTARSAW